MGRRNAIASTAFPVAIAAGVWSASRSSRVVTGAPAVSAPRVGVGEARSENPDSAEQVAASTLAIVRDAAGYVVAQPDAHPEASSRGGATIRGRVSAPGVAAVPLGVKVGWNVLASVEFMGTIPLGDQISVTRRTGDFELTGLTDGR